MHGVIAGPLDEPRRILLRERHGALHIPRWSTRHLNRCWRSAFVCESMPVALASAFQVGRDGCNALALGQFERIGAERGVDGCVAVPATGDHGSRSWCRRCVRTGHSQWARSAPHSCSDHRGAVQYGARDLGKVAECRGRPRLQRRVRAHFHAYPFSKRLPALPSLAHNDQTQG
jgi:hypothetical protein